ncbi:uncharacterized protein C8A04DRAFT_26602 [Dichotomopilus funicola]|uniref:Cytochrome b561 domain-containing protein n=1 Tax=Dichotomopilus funicola TaxID=1934379 RepID=A0AAN6V6B1_9PEZI|nr:hypothetical protein C8A04DRAFT_26602 [Dichotomopilus funicola]
MHFVPRYTLAGLALAATALAQQSGGYYSGNGNPSNGQGPGGNSRSGFGGFGGNFDFDEATRIRAIHGILGAVAMAVLFPSGSMLMRLFPGKAGLWLHSIMQIIALGILVAAVALGIRLVQQMREFGIDLIGNANTNSHFIIGLVVLICLLLQPVFGLLHHEKFKHTHQRQVWSYLHLFNGRICITLGIINGGLGLWLAGAAESLKVGYVAAAAAMWLIWMSLALWSELKRWRAQRPPSSTRRKPREGEVAF